MSHSPTKKVTLAALALAVSCVLAPLTVTRTLAADHGDSPVPSQDQGADIGDVFLFLDPNDNDKVILAFDVHGFIVPGENENLGFFDPDLRFRFQVENSGDARGDIFIDVSFTKQTSRKEPQTATIKMNGRTLFTAPTTVSSATAQTAPAPVVTTDPTTGIAFFAGLTDDPFFFDIPAELLYRKSRQTGTINPAVFSRGRDSFAGYNIAMIALSAPVSLLRGSGSTIGLTAFTQRLQKTSAKGFSRGKFVKGQFVNIDRMGIPAVNTVFIPFGRKDEYNRSSTEDDANGKFKDDEVKSLKALQTDDTSIGILASVAILNGDILRLDPTIHNSGPGGGTNPAAGFPNGRRPADDTIDVIVTLVNNRQQVNPGSDKVDNVNANDVPLRDTFPFFAPPHQPQPAGTIDDDTRN